MVRFRHRKRSCFCLKYLVLGGTIPAGEAVTNRYHIPAVDTLNAIGKKRDRVLQNTHVWCLKATGNIAVTTSGFVICLEQWSSVVCSCPSPPSDNVSILYVLRHFRNVNMKFADVTYGRLASFIRS